jgi:hypothetical protein
MQSAMLIRITLCASALVAIELTFPRPDPDQCSKLVIRKRRETAAAAKSTAGATSSHDPDS